MSNKEDLFYQIALLQTSRIGPITAKKLFQHFGSAKNIFENNYKELLASGFVNSELAQDILKQKHFSFAEEEIKFIEKHDISVFNYEDKDYPKRLKNFEDAPFLVYYKGNCNLNSSKVVSIVGTRKPTEYGKRNTEQIITELKDYNVTIVSGLAFGIDSCAHHKSNELGIPNVGVVAHGLDRIYPHQHKKLSKRIVEIGGGILTEFPTRTEPVPGNFPARNRIIAGLCDVLIVSESGKSGGSIITAIMANEYQKDVFAIPGRIGDPYSEGCNNLIKTHKASLLNSVDDISYIMQWDKQNQSNQRQLFIQLTDEEKQITDLMIGQDKIHFNYIIQETKTSTSILASILLELEMKGIIKSMPGKYFRLI